MTPFDAILACGAVYRLTVLASTDNITRPLRNRLFGRWPQTREFLDCYWCVSIWAAGLVVAGRVLPSDVWTAGCIGLCASAVTGLVGPRE